jgi:undecaprenyl-diphosphatase
LLPGTRPVIFFAWSIQVRGACVPPSSSPFAQRALLVCAALLIAAGCALRSGGFDPVLLLRLHAESPSHAAVIAWSCITVLGMAWPALIVVTALDRQSGRLTALLVPTFIIGSVLTRVPKFLIAAPRPAGTPIRESLHIIGHAFTGAVSMPSGHSLTAAAAAGLIWAAWPAARRIPVAFAVFAAAAAIGFSRLMVGAHWPSDVTVGFGLGLLAVALSMSIPVDRLARRIASRPGQLWLAAFEVVLAVGFVAENTGYPEGQPMVVAFACIAVISAAWRTYAVVHRRQWARAEAA